MATIKIKQLKETYEFACNEYVQKFCNKQEMTNEGWVNDDVGGIALCSDFYFNLHDIVSVSYTHLTLPTIYSV